MKKNTQWWIADRDADGNGLFDVDHQLETGMDDLDRRWENDDKPARYEAVDATAYALANLRAVAAMAGELDLADDAKHFSAYADKAEAALNTICWDGATHAYRDRHKATGELSDYTAITIFYPLFAGAAGPDQLSVIRNQLLDPARFWLPYPIPALSKADREFNPVKRYWAGPSWPAATSHVVEGFATTAKRHDRSLLPRAAELFKLAAALHLQPRADFYERYDPFGGKGLSNFRDYMHSWWIDLYVRHVAGFNPQPDGSAVVDALPLGLSHYALRNVPWRGRRVDVLYNADDTRGLTVRVDGKVVLSRPDYVPGAAPANIPAGR
jgi:glycogen debranching enzyme